MREVEQSFFRQGTATFSGRSEVGRGYVAVLWDSLRARYLGAGPYAALVRRRTAQSGVDP
jgi:hypothetical protein